MVEVAFQILFFPFVLLESLVLNQFIVISHLGLSYILASNRLRVIFFIGGNKFSARACCLLLLFSYGVVSDTFGLHELQAHQATLSMGFPRARILEWGAISFSRGSFWPRDWTYFSCLGRQILYHWATKKAPGAGIFAAISLNKSMEYISPSF